MTKMLAVNFTDGRTTETMLFDPRGDTEETVARLTDKMRARGWYPVKGSGRIVMRERDGNIIPFVERTRLHYGPQKVA